MESEYCIFTIAVAVVVIIVVLSLVILLRDIIRFFYKKTQISSPSRSATLPIAENEEEKF